MAKSVSPDNSPVVAVPADATTPPGNRGDRIYSSHEHAVLVHDGTAWRNPAAGGAPLVASGTSAGTLAAGAAEGAQQGTASTAARSDHWHPTASTTNSGLMSAAQVTTLNTAAAKADLVAIGGAAGSATNGSPHATSQGTATTAARSDHWHPLATSASAGTVMLTGASTAGTLATGAPQPAQAGAATTPARSDHQHPPASTTNNGLMTTAQVTSLNAAAAKPDLPTASTAGTLATGAPQATQAGAAATAARSDHQHPDATQANPGLMTALQVVSLNAAAAKPSLVAANTAGTLAGGAPQAAHAGAATTAARSDHQHPPATTTNSGLMTAAHVTSLNAAGAKPDLPTASTAGTLATGAPQPGDAGAATSAARSDHQHPIATPSNAGLMSTAQASRLADAALLTAEGSDLANALLYDATLAGLAAEAARADHLHDGSQIVGLLLGETDTDLNEVIEELRQRTQDANDAAGARATLDDTMGAGPGTLANGASQTAQKGTAPLAARTDHQHPIATASNAGLMSAAQAQAVASAAVLATAGAGGTLATGAPQAAQQGSATTAARSDHQHPIATATNAGLMSAAQAQAVASAAVLATASAGGTLATGAPQAAQQGSATTAARSDHQHPIATASNAGLMSAAHAQAVAANGQGATSLTDLEYTTPATFPQLVGFDLGGATFAAFKRPASTFLPNPLPRIDNDFLQEKTEWRAIASSATPFRKGATPTTLGTAVAFGAENPNYSLLQTQAAAGSFAGLTWPGRGHGTLFLCRFNIQNLPVGSRFFFGLGRQQQLPLSIEPSQSAGLAGYGKIGLGWDSNDAMSSPLNIISTYNGTTQNKTPITAGMGGVVPWRISNSNYLWDMAIYWPRVLTGTTSNVGFAWRCAPPGTLSGLPALQGQPWGQYELSGSIFPRFAAMTDVVYPQIWVSTGSQAAQVTLQVSAAYIETEL